MSNPWLAIDVATAPAQRAREVRRAWERFVGDGWERFAGRGESRTVREPIADSWRRSAAAGVDPSGTRIAPVVADADETSARWEIHPLAEMAPLIRSCLAASADESRHLIVVSDANGILLWVEGNANVRMRAADSMNFAEGTLWSEGGAGTNAIGTALAAEHAVQVFATEHFNEVVQAWTCAAAPVHDPDTGQVIGVIDLTGEMSTVHPHSMAVATATAQAVEAQLRCQMLDRDGRLLARYGDQLTAGSGAARAGGPERAGDRQPAARLAAGGAAAPAAGRRRAARRRRAPRWWPRCWAARRPTWSARPAVPASARHRGAADRRALSSGPARAATGPRPTLGGRRKQLRLRHSEILTLLCGHPEGLTSEELSAGVYGTGDRTGGIRVEISRLRKLLGDCIETEPLPPARRDLQRLRAGVRPAAPRRGPRGRRALSGAAAAGLQRARRGPRARGARELAAPVGDERRRPRGAVGVAADARAGSDDLAAWQRLLADLPFQDPRRSLAASRIGQLRSRAADDAVALAPSAAGAGPCNRRDVTPV